MTSLCALLVRDDPVGRRVQWTLFAGPFLFMGGLVALKLYDWRRYWSYVAREDSPVEYLTALLFGIGAVLAFVLSLRFHRRRRVLHAVLTAGLTAGMLFVSLEEISWGQRIFGWQTPGVLQEHNVQGETNLHNLAGRYPLHMSFILVGLYGTLAFALVPGILSRFVPGRYEELSDLVAPPWFVASYFFPTFLLYVYYDYLSPVLAAVFGEGWDWQRGQGGERFMIGKDQEPVELILSMGFLLFVGYLYGRWASGTGGRRESRDTVSATGSCATPGPP